MSRASRPAASNATTSLEISIDLVEGAGPLGSTTVTVPARRASFTSTRPLAQTDSDVLEEEASTTACRPAQAPS